MDKNHKINRNIRIILNNSRIIARRLVYLKQYLEDHKSKPDAADLLAVSSNGVEEYECKLQLFMDDLKIILDIDNDYTKYREVSLEFSKLEDFFTEFSQKVREIANCYNMLEEEEEFEEEEDFGQISNEKNPDDYLQRNDDGDYEEEQ